MMWVCSQIHPFCF